MRNVANIKERYNSLCIPLKRCERRKFVKKLEKIGKISSAARSRIFPVFSWIFLFFHTFLKLWIKKNTTFSFHENKNHITSEITVLPFLRAKLLYTVWNDTPCRYGPIIIDQVRTVLIKFYVVCEKALGLVLQRERLCDTVNVSWFERP